MEPPYLAHTRDGRRQELREHLEAVAGLARGFADVFGAGEWAYVAGLWHDLGKYSDAFQDYLRLSASPDSHVAEVAARVDHSSAGAQHAARTIDLLGHLLAYPIAGHHSGLLDTQGEGACQDRRLQKELEPYDAAPADLLTPPALETPPALLDALRRRDGFAVAFFVRMIFSCLVDADFLDTEAFMDADRAAARPAWPDDVLERMAAALDDHVASLGRAPDGEPSDVDRQRALVRAACLQSAELEPGFFSLTVPTGGGKTFSSLAFALRHALAHDLGRVVYVVPFTTIIEQNADAFRRALAPLGIEDLVVEHHSNLDAGKETVTSRLATENWDAPLVVTTSVQLYESLFANRTSRCRKLHNLARSVVVLDEVQTLPVDYLAPCLRALRELVRGYGATVVLCTATQPAVHRRDDFPVGLEDVREIVPDPEALYHALRRVRVEDLGKQDDATIADRLRAEPQVLCIVNTRGHARALYEALGEVEGRFHLSALMCPEHRSARLAEIKRRLADGLPCRVVSTQLVEAGVDVDFPVVYRSLAGLDSIAQAAGRCNREGRLPEMGRTYVFRSEHRRAERFVADTASCAHEVLTLPRHDDPLALAAIEHYFRLYYWNQSDRWDAKMILDALQLGIRRELPFLFQFREVARDFRLIDDAGEPVIVPWGDEGAALAEKLRALDVPPGRALLRRLQRYTVQIPRRQWEENAGRAFELVQERYPVLLSPETHYSDELGLVLDRGELAFLNV